MAQSSFSALLFQLLLSAGGVKEKKMRHWGAVCWMSSGFPNSTQERSTDSFCFSKNWSSSSVNSAYWAVQTAFRGAITAVLGVRPFFVLNWNDSRIYFEMQNCSRPYCWNLGLQKACEADVRCWYQPPHHIILSHNISHTVKSNASHVYQIISNFRAHSWIWSVYYYNHRSSASWDTITTHNSSEAEAVQTSIPISLQQAISWALHIRRLV